MSFCKDGPAARCASRPTCTDTQGTRVQSHHSTLLQPSSGRRRHFPSATSLPPGSGSGAGKRQMQSVTCFSLPSRASCRLGCGGRLRTRAPPGAEGGLAGGFLFSLPGSDETCSRSSPPQKAGNSPHMSLLGMPWASCTSCGITCAGRCPISGLRPIVASLWIPPGCFCPDCCAACGRARGRRGLCSPFPNPFPMPWLVPLNSARGLLRGLPCVGPPHGLFLQPAHNPCALPSSFTCRGSGLPPLAPLTPSTKTSGVRTGL